MKKPSGCDFISPGCFMVVYVLIELVIPGNALQGVIFRCLGHFSAF